LVGQFLPNFEVVYLQNFYFLFFYFTNNLQDASNRKDENGVRGRKRKSVAPGIHQRNQQENQPEKEQQKKRRTDAPQEEVEQWKAVTQETGWDEPACLSHKLTFPKRCDATKKLDVLATHLKRLRAVGWSLYQEKCDYEAEIGKVRHQLAIEREARASDDKTAKEAQHAASQRLSDLENTIDDAEQKIKRLNCELEAANALAQETDRALKEAEVERQQALGQVAAQKITIDGLTQRLTTAEQSVSESQRYNAQLQDYNTKVHADLAAANDQLDAARQEKAFLAEETAVLRGKVTALGDSLSALQSISDGAEAARLAATEELARLRAALAAETANKDNLVDELRRVRTENDDLRQQVDRFRAATGKELAALEAEREASAVLASRTEAQAAALGALQDQLALVKEQKMAAEARVDVLTSENRTLNAKLAEFESLYASAEQRLRDAEVLRRRLHNTILELKGNVRVFCRIRPRLSCPSAVVDSSSEAVTDIRDGDLVGRGVKIVMNNQKTMQFTYDRVFNCSSTQEEVFEEVSALVQSALDGYHVCIFAYGQTNSGKTYTMLGGGTHPEQAGIIPRALKQLFVKAQGAAAQGWTYEMHAAMLEIYNEEIRDLVGNGPPPGKKHTILNGPGEGVGEKANEKSYGMVTYLEWVPVKDVTSVDLLLRKATAHRAVGATACNEQSSRSHMVFMLQVQGVNEATGQRSSGALNLVDLAGSERIGKSEVAGARLKETQAINKSLSALGDVIAALGQRESHVPYRNSKLTHLLQRSLGGAGKALMLCTVSPTEENAAETLCTLRFAAKVNATEIGTARRNVTY
jgi:kinesin family protein C1